jgi:hypothetical protein
MLYDDYRDEDRNYEESGIEADEDEPEIKKSSKML